MEKYIAPPLLVLLAPAGAFVGLPFPSLWSVWQLSGITREDVWLEAGLPLEERYMAFRVCVFGRLGCPKAGAPEAGAA